jgi:hypothetical protein
VEQPPAVGLEGCEGSPDLVLRARSDAAAAGEARPVASVDQQREGDEPERARNGEGSGTLGDHGQHPGGEGGHATRNCAAQAPVLLAAAKARSDHGQKLASGPDERSP